MLIAFNKPYGVLCQFTDKTVPPRPTLAGFSLPPDVYAAGRLDQDSEGLLLLSDDGPLIARISSPKFHWPKTYLVQVEGVAGDEHLAQLRSGVTLADGVTRPAKAQVLIGAPDWLWPRDPPIRYRAAIPTSWLEIRICEGKNRQVRKMTAGVGFPTLRLVRYSIGGLNIEGWHPGELRSFTREEFYKLVFNG